MTKYRIKVEGQYFTPQYQCSYWPFWLSWKGSHQGGGMSAIKYNTRKEAQRVINDDRVEIPLEKVSYIYDV